MSCSLPWLQGHETSVLALAVSDDGTIASGSGDRTIRIWRDGSCAAVLKGHDDTVRGLCYHPAIGLVSGETRCPPVLTNPRN